MSNDGDFNFSIGRLIAVLFMSMIVIVGGTYAWFSYQSKQSALVLSIGDLNDARVTLSPYQINETMTPVNEHTSGVYSQIKAVNNSSNGMIITLYYKINELDENLASNGLKYTVASSNTIDGEYTEVVTGDFTTSVGEEEAVVLDTKIDSSMTVYYRVYLWLDSDYGNQAMIQNTSLDLELNADLDQEPIAPVLDEGMIPVTISNDGTVTTISSDDENWYNYRDQEWANVVLVTDDSRSSYLNTTGVEVTSSDILAYYVWIPRYRYRIWTTGVSATGNEQEIEILFETSASSRILGTDIDQYRTHPAFWWDNDSDGTYDDGELLPGIWVGKFETTGTADSPTVLPNSTALTTLSVSEQFSSALNFAGGTLSNSYVGFIGNNTYGLTGDTDSHMMKNNEWGAVAYLSHSKYGINDEVRLNNNSNSTTGCGASSANGASTTECQINYNSASSYPQSTTGNITGIFDMSGGISEFVMGYNTTYYYDDRSGFEIFPEIKYYDSYTLSSASSCDIGSCGGSAISETSGWYSDMISLYFPWFYRGSANSDGASAGLYALSSDMGYQSFAFRSVLVPISEEMQDTTLPSASITSTNNVAVSQTATLTMSDNSAVAAYYFGTSNPSTTTVIWTSIDYIPSTTVSKTVTSAGTYYLGVKDSYGNEAVVSKVFYNTTLSISNGSVSPTSVITMGGNKFTLPSPVLSDGYKFDGWYTSSSYSGSPITTYTPTGNTTLYGKTSLSTIYVDAPTASYCKTLTYTGASQTLTNTAGEGYTFSGNTGTNAGDYTVTAKLSSGYAWSDGTSTDKTFTCSIGKKSVAVTWGTTTSFAYNGSPQSPTASVATGITGETMTIAKTSATNAGSYTSIASCSSVTGGQSTCDNYVLTGGNKTFTITKVTPTITLSAASGNVNVGSTATFTATTKSAVSAAGTLTATSGTTANITITGGASTSITATSSGVATTITYKGVKVASSTITVKFTPTDTTNFNSASKTFTASGVDTSAPSGGSLAASVSGTTVTGKFSSVTDNVGISQYYYAISTSSTCPTSGYTASTNTSYNFTGKSAGTYYVCGYVTDSAGNKSSTYKSSAVTISVTFANKITSLYNASATATHGSYSYSYDTTDKLMKDGEGNTRYYGASPNNYVYFNCTTYPSTGCETWRIIGVINGYVRIVRSSSIGSYARDYNGTYTVAGSWGSTSMQTILNSGAYYNLTSGTCGIDAVTTETCNFSSTGLKNAKTRTSMIANSSWKIAGSTHSGAAAADPSVIAQTEFDGSSWTGRVGLPSIADIVFAMDFTNYPTSANYTWNNYYYYDEYTWLLPASSWLLNNNSNSTATAYWIDDTLHPSGGATAYNRMNIWPTVQLATSVIYVSGSGTSSSPYRINVG